MDDDLTAVRDLLSTPGPSREVTDGGRARLLAAAWGRPPRKHRPGGWTAPFRYGLVAATLATALGVAVLTPSGSLVLSPDPAATASNAPTARQILLAAATAMARTPSAGDYWRARTVTGKLIVSPDRGYVLRRDSASETWLSRSPDKRGWSFNQYLGARPAAEADKLAWQMAGEPVSWRYPADVTGMGFIGAGETVQSAAGARVGGPPKGPVNWEEVDRIPAGAAALRSYLEHKIGDVSDRERVSRLRKGCMEILSGLPVSAEVRASAYQVMASLPGMTAEGEVTDPLGRTGQGLSYQVNKPEGQVGNGRFVIDPDSGFPLANETKGVGRLADGRSVEVSTFTAYQQIGWTDEEPDLEGARAGDGIHAG
ncbi:CU044_5270 family protein [Nonomuraea typhae]|uniref:CU044_5270 family protein n=1 Tax=Nonomuraea typhae TaxID=2603600 RepID=UPI0012FC339B|nr:CU044_5270 family protein [Nonomuraea typhae]